MCHVHNYSPLNYTGSIVSQNQTVCYEISLINLTLPNVLTASINYANGQPYVSGNAYGNSQVISLLANFSNNRISTTVGAVAHCLIRGMTPQRADFNNGRDTAAWLRVEIEKVIKDGGTYTYRILLPNLPHEDHVRIHDKIYSLLNDNGYKYEIMNVRMIGLNAENNSRAIELENLIAKMKSS